MIEEMTPKLPDPIEQAPEHIPADEEVRAIFERLLGGKEYNHVRRFEDARGLYLWDIAVTETDGHTEYDYLRKGRYAQGECSVTRIDVTYYDDKDVPISGHSIAMYENGAWKLTP